MTKFVVDNGKNLIQAYDAAETDAAINSKSAVNEKIITSNLMGIDAQENLYSGASDWSGEWNNSDPAHLALSDEYYFGYRAMYSSETWRRLNKNIPVESGKTYTFSVMVKVSNGTGVYVYATHNTDTTNPATISQSVNPYLNLTPNVWHKLSLTFNCTQSGNVSPYVITTYGTIYFAKYMLCEGTKTFSLTDSLNEKANTEYVSGFGDYKKITKTLNDAGIQEYWNIEFPKEISAGTKIKFIFDSYSGDYLSYIKVSGQTSGGVWSVSLITITDFIRGISAETIAPDDYVKLRIQLYRTINEQNVTASFYLATDEDLGVVNDLLNMNNSRVFRVEKDGSGDFTKLVDAINYASNLQNAIVKVGAGIWDIVSEFGSEYMESVTQAKRGLYLKNGIHVICSSRALITAKYEGSNNSTREWFSAFNAGIGGFILENARIETDNIRYTVHDERDADADAYFNHYLNCSMKHTNGFYRQCIGGGLGLDGHIIVEGCVFENDKSGENNALISWHNSNDGYYAQTESKNAQSFIEVKGNYFVGNGTCDFIKFGQSQKVTDVIVHDNSLGAEPILSSGSYAPYNNMRMLEWNNEIRTT